MKTFKSIRCIRRVTQGAKEEYTPIIHLLKLYYRCTTYTTPVVQVYMRSTTPEPGCTPWLPLGRELIIGRGHNIVSNISQCYPGNVIKARCAPSYTLFALSLSWWLIIKRTLGKKPFSQKMRHFLMFFL